MGSSYIHVTRAHARVAVITGRRLRIPSHYQLAAADFAVFRDFSRSEHHRAPATAEIALLNGRRLVALSENTATIETRTGARQTYYRRPKRRGEALAWELAE